MSINNIRLTYEKIFERSQGTLAETRDSFHQKIQIAKESQGDKFKLISTVKFTLRPKCNCGNTVECKIVFLKNNIEMCPKCRKQNNKHKGKGLTTQNLEVRSIEFLGTYLEDTFDVLLCYETEGTDPDIAIKRKNIDEDAWVKVQCKASENERAIFGFRKNTYPDSIIICHQTFANQNNFWLIPANNENIMKGLSCVKCCYKTGYYTQFKIDPKDLSEKILGLYDDITKFTQKQCMLPKSPDAQLEHAHRTIRKQALPDLKVEYLSFSHTDAIINGMKVQDKVRSCTKRKNQNSFNFCLRKRESTKKVNYDIGDNQLYWFYLNNTNVFYVIPEEELIDKNNSQKTRLSLSLYEDHRKCHRTKSKDRWTENYQFNYKTINEPEEKARLMRLFDQDD